MGFTAEVDAQAALAYAATFLAPGSAVSPEQFVADILGTDGTARASLRASIGAGRFADEVAILAELTRPIAVLHGEGEQLVSLDYLRGLTMPTAWRGGVQVLPGVGHTPQVEAPEQFGTVLAEFINELG